MRRALLPCLFALAAIGCAETAATCPDDLVRDPAGDCVSLEDAGGADDGGGVDGGADDGGGADGGVDAGPAGDAGADAATEDAGPCAETCGGTLPYCDPGSGDCVECLEAEHCSGETDLCDTTSGACVECLLDTDCPLDEPVCNAGTCELCDAPADCTGRVDADSNPVPACNPAGACVACATEANCGGQVCSRLTWTCTGRAANGRGDCDACEADADCFDGVCAREMFGGLERGWVCYPRAMGTAGSTFCADADKPFTRRVLSAPTIDGGDPADLCAPVLTTTCAALDEVGNMCDLTSSTLCGDDSLADGRCELMQHSTSGSRNECTISCSADKDCPDGYECTGGVSDDWCELPMP